MTNEIFNGGVFSFARTAFVFLLAQILMWNARWCKDGTKTLQWIHSTSLFAELDSASECDDLRDGWSSGFCGLQRRDVDEPGEVLVGGHWTGKEGKFIQQCSDEAFIVRRSESLGYIPPCMWIWSAQAQLLGEERGEWKIKNLGGDLVCDWMGQWGYWGMCRRKIPIWKDPVVGFVVRMVFKSRRSTDEYVSLYR